MSRTMRLAVLAVAALALCAATASTAGAVTWHNSGDTAFTATAGAETFSSTSVNLACTGGTAIGTAPSTSFVGATWTGVAGTLTFSGCLLSGQSVGVDCGYTWTASSQSGAATNGDRDLTCGVYLAGVKVCHLAGYLPSTYANPVQPFTFGRFSLHVSNTMRSFNGVTSCPLGNGDALVSSAMTLTISAATGGPSSPHLGPVVTRTA